MSKIKSLIRRLKNKDYLTPEELIKLAHYIGFQKTGHTGSHHKMTYKDNTLCVVVNSSDNLHQNDTINILRNLYIQEGFIRIGGCMSEMEMKNRSPEFIEIPEGFFDQDKPYKFYRMIREHCHYKMGDLAKALNINYYHYRNFEVQDTKSRNTRKDMTRQQFTTFCQFLKLDERLVYTKLPGLTFAPEKPQVSITDTPEPIPNAPLPPPEPEPIPNAILPEPKPEPIPNASISEEVEQMPETTPQLPSTLILEKPLAPSSIVFTPIKDDHFNKEDLFAALSIKYERYEQIKAILNSIPALQAEFETLKQQLQILGMV